MRNTNKNQLVVALLGNPNCGKTSLFNELTGSRQHVGNWPGVTVEKKEGICNYNDKEIKIVDLPGTYSLGAYSEDEVVARNYILKDKPDVVINVVDSTNIERNLYLTTQLLEMNTKVVIALNMMDEAEARDIKINVNKLEEGLNVAVVPTVATKKQGIDKLIERVIEVAHSGKISQFNLKYGNNIENEIENLKMVANGYSEALKYPKEWVALKLLENDEFIIEEVNKSNNTSIISQLNKSNENILVSEGMEADSIIVDKRYDFVAKVVQNSVKKKNTMEYTKSDRIDKIVTNKWLGIPIFLGIMLIVYEITFKIGQPLADLIGDGFGSLGEFLEGKLPEIGAPDLLTSFIVSGIIDGLGSVLGFVALIFVLYFLISLLEDSGYMARAAYVMDKLMRALGLHGKTFIPMIIGSGCNVPGIMATRTLDSKKDRMIAILINPFISCSARLPIYAVFVSAFFPRHGGIVYFSLYLLGIIMALLMGKIFSKTLFKGETSYFIMELPPYRIPTAKSVIIHMWEKGSSFLKKAGTVILGAVILIWVLSNLPFGVEPASEESVIGIIGSFIAPIFAPAGFGTWQASVSLITGILAKETVVTTLGVIYAGAAEGEGVIHAIQQAFTPLTAYAFMVMSLLYTPCAAAIGAIRQETNSRKWALFTAVYTFIVGWIAAVLVFQIGKLLGFN